MVRPRVFFDIAVDGNLVGRVIFELFNDTAPKTCENLCTGEKGLSALSERPLYYKNSIIHRSIKDFMIQGGVANRFHKRNGSGGESIYGGPFPDEDLSRPVDSEGLLCMANKGPNTNGSQFFVTLRPCPHLNGKHVVFGRVLRGYQEVIQKITEVPVDEKDRPTVPVTIQIALKVCSRRYQRDSTANARLIEAETRSQSDSNDDVEREQRKHKKRRHKHNTGTISDDESDEGHSKRRRHKKSKRKDRSRSHSRAKDVEDSDRKRTGTPEEETEEQYDARLEREEKERLEEQRRKELERLKRLKEDVPTTNGVRFKGMLNVAMLLGLTYTRCTGRGRMKYMDPELRRD
ncbi:cyclophilin-like domain-containing protein [Irpex lacteus]|nr:cyclophilin-like domain-containing protein [Irpex lacteus]